MKTAGIIAEYNPFHNGHLYHLRQTRAAGYGHIVAVMSSNVVQRSEVACFSKWTRATAAVKSGVNLVIELPAVYAIAGAEKFARAGVSILNGLGLVDGLSFGSESGDLRELKRCAQFCEQTDGSPVLSEFLEQGLPFPKARERAVEQIAGSEISALLRTPNNILAIEYLKALKATSSSMEPFTCRRKGPGHDSKTHSARYASATLIREILQHRGIYDLYRFFPEDAFQLFQQDFALKSGGASMYELSSAVLYRLRTMTPEAFACLPDVSEGLEYRLCAEAKNAISIDDFLKRVKTKRYTMSRLKRIIIHALLDIDRNLAMTPPPYIRVLAFDPKGAEILRKAKKTASLPIYHSFAKLQNDFPLLAEKEALATDLFRYACPKIPAGNSEYQNRRSFSIRTGAQK